jgi:hypothetical protein
MSISAANEHFDRSWFRLDADHLYQTVIDYHSHKAGTLGQSVH